MLTEWLAHHPKGKISSLAKNLADLWLVALFLLNIKYQTTVEFFKFEIHDVRVLVFSFPFFLAYCARG